MESFWDRLGLKGNPYDPKPLTLSEEDMKLFVGRNNELAQLNTLTSGGNGGIIIIEGDFGVGKTSFVNMFQYEKQKNEKILPSFESIELFENTDLVNFMLSVFSKMIFNLEKFDETNASKKHNIHSESKSLIADTILKGWGGNISIMGTGGGATQTKTIAKSSTVVLPTLLNKMDEWVEFVKNKMNFSSIIIPMDNFDNINDNVINNFLNNARDTLITRKNIWWIIIGQKGLFSMLEKKSHKVSEIITGKPVVLEALTLDEVHDMVDRRYKILKKSKDVEPIIPKKIIDILYDISGGEPRYILKRLSDMVFAFMQNFPSENQIPDKIVKDLLLKEAKRRINEEGLTKRQLEILKKMAKIGEFQPKDYKKFKLDTRQALKDYIDKFIDFGFLTIKRKLRKEVFYRATGDVILYFKNTL